MEVHLLLENTLPGLGYELADLQLAKSGLIRVFIDKPGGITIEDCTLVSNHLTRLFMVEDIQYSRLEVSSPGLDRPLKKESDFQRFTGKLAKIKTRLPIDQQRQFLGRIIASDDVGVKLALDNRIIDIPFTNIDKARLEPEI